MQELKIGLVAIPIGTVIQELRILRRTSAWCGKRTHFLAQVGRGARKVVVAATVEQTRVKLDQIAAAIENDRAHTIVEHDSDDAAPIRESMDVALNEMTTPD